MNDKPKSANDHRFHHLRAVRVRESRPWFTRLLERRVPEPDAFRSPTPRARRAASETDGEDYIFITREEFEDAPGRGEFLEYAEVFGNYYGTHRETLEAATRQGSDLVLDIDVQGARQLKSRDSGGGQYFYASAVAGDSGAAACARGRRIPRK